MTLAVVLHDIGEADGGASWRTAVPSPAWEVLDLPGHGVAPAPRHGAYDPMGPMTLARWRIAHHGVDGSLAVGVGENAMGALLLAGGAGCAAVAIVDGLHGPWPTTGAERIDVTYRQIRSVLADPASQGPAPVGTVDPRTAFGYALVTTPRQCRAFWGCLEVPTLVVETPRSSTPADERAERVGWFGGPTTLVEVDSAEPSVVLAAVDGWWGALPGPG